MTRLHADRFRASHLTRLAILLAVGLILGRLEAMLPPLPVPGAKLGLANLAVLAALACEGSGAALLVAGARLAAGAWLGGGLFSLIYAGAGAALALAAMIIGLRLRGVSLVGASVLGAAAHHVGQLCAASILLGSPKVWSYLPVLTLIAVFTGALLGELCILALRALSKAKLIVPSKTEWIML